MFQDLVYSLEIAAHEAGLEHYAPRMYLDAVNVTQHYRECFVPEDWRPPFAVRAEIEFELAPLDAARSQMSDREIIRALGVMMDAGDGGGNLPITVNLAIKFILAVDMLNAPSRQWNAYCHQVAGRDRLQAGLENLQRRLQRAVGPGQERPALHVEARTTLTPAGQLALSELCGHWPVAIKADSEDYVRQAVLEDLMKRVRAGLEVLEAFAQGIREDFGEK